MKLINRKSLLVCVLAGAINVSHAAPQFCQTKVTDLWVDGTGNTYVFMAVLGNYVQTCNLNATWKGVAPVTCMGWMSMLRSAVSRNSDVVLNYSDAPACTALPVYGNAPAPFYVMLKN